MLKFDRLFCFLDYTDIPARAVWAFFLVLLFCAGAGLGSEVSEAVSKGNRLYAEGEFAAAGAEYDRALELKPGLPAPKFNKANSDYKLKELEAAIDAYKEVAARSADKKLIAKAKYNLGNSYFRKAREAEAASQSMPVQQPGQQGPLEKQADAGNPVDDYRAAVKSWRQALDMDAGNENAKRNIEIAKHAIKKLKEQQQQQQNQDQQQDGENPENQEKKNQENDDKNKQGQDQQEQKDNDDNQDDKKNDPQQGEDENQQDKKDQKDQQQGREDDKEKSRPEPQDQDESDAAADEILKKEKQDKKERRVMIMRKVPVEKDW